MSDRYTLHVGDCRDWLKTLPSESVQCCVTSPPYFGLRDYGTAKWEGGDVGCDHQPPNDVPNGNRGQPVTHAGRACGDCRKCGAVRIDSQIGLESTPDAFIAALTEVFREVRRVLRKDGTCWVNMGDSYNANQGPGFDTNNNGRGKRSTDSGYATSTPKVSSGGLPPKNRLMIPARLALSMQADGWVLRDEIVWHKPNPMPESTTDRCTKAHEMLYLLTKSSRYYWNHAANQEPATYSGQGRGGSTNRYEQNAAGMDNREYATRNRRSVWTIQPASYSGAHFAVFPEELVRPCVELGSRPGDVVLEPFAGSGTTLAVAVSMGREAWGCELNPAYAELIRKRLRGVTPPLFEEMK